MCAWNLIKTLGMAGFIGSTLLVSAKLSARETKSYIPYPVDYKPFEKYSELYKEWREFKAKYNEVVIPIPVLKRQLELMETVSAQEPQWIDGYWLVTDLAFQLGASFTDPKDHDFARSVFVKGKKSAEKCLEKQKNNPLCKLLLGASMGKIASIDGILSSLKNAKLVNRLWIEVTESSYNHAFSESSSLQGNARYALGMFYRLVPDFFLMDWLFDVRGDINKSIAYHREAIQVDPPNPCNKIMLAASLLCSVQGKTSTPIGKEAIQHLQDARSLAAKSNMTRACQTDTEKLEKAPDKACGYETSKQQDTSEEAFKKQQTSQNNQLSH